LTSNLTYPVPTCEPRSGWDFSRPPNAKLNLGRGLRPNRLAVFQAAKALPSRLNPGQ